MSTKLIILGLLQKGPMHGYEVKRQIEHEEMADWAGISYGAIYFALNRLADEGFVEKIATERMGKRPSRDVYQITEKGQGEFLRLLRGALSTVEHKADSVSIGVRFMYALPHEEVQARLEERREMLEQIRQSVTEERATFADEHRGKPYLETTCTLFDRSLVYLEAELNWLQSVLERLEQGLFPWPSRTEEE